MALILSIILFVFSLYCFRVFFKFAKGKVDLSILIVAVMGFYYGGGSILGLFVAPEYVRSEMLADLKLSTGDLVWPLILIIFYALSLFVLGRIWRFASIDKQYLAQTLFEVVSQKRNFIIYLVVLLLQVYLIFTGRVAFGGFQKEEGELFRVSPLALLVFPATFALIFSASFGMFCKTLAAPARIACLLIVLSQLAFTVFHGRRIVAVALALAFFGLVLTGATRKRVVTIASVLSVIFVVLFVSFYALRIAGYSSDLKGASGIETVRGQVTSIDEVIESRNSETTFFESLRLNVSTRPFIVGYFAMLTKGSGTGALGEVTMYSIGTAIPSVLWRGKDALLASGNEEYIAFNVFGLPRFTDEANTIITSGYTEIPVVGPLLFMLILYVIIGACFSFVRMINIPEVTILVFATLWVCCLNFESSFGAWLVAIRDLAIWILILAIFSSMNKRSGRRAQTTVRPNIHGGQKKLQAF